MPAKTGYFHDMVAYHHAAQTFEDVKRQVAAHLASLFPVKGTKRELRLTGPIDVQDTLAHDDYASQRDARMQGSSWSIPVKAPVELYDIELGKVISRGKIKILDLPRMTNRGTYIVGGSEYAFPTQKRLKPGAYVRTAQDGVLQTQVNLRKGRNFKLGIHPDKGHFQVQIESTQNLKLYPLLTALGVTEGQMAAAWGPEVLASNIVKDPSQFTKDLRRIYELLTYGAVPVPEERGELFDAVRKLFSETEWDADNVGVTLGRKSPGVDATALLLMTKKMLGVSRGEVKEDNRDSLIHNDFVDLADYMVERFNDKRFTGRIERTLKVGVDKAMTVGEVINRNAFQRPIDSLMTESDISKSPTQGNPLGMISDYTNVTVRGEGGIQDDHMLTASARALDPSHLGFLDPAHTPEGAFIGTTLHMTTGARKVGRSIVKKVWDLKNDKLVEIDPIQAHRSTVAFPDYFDPTKRKLKPINGKVKVMRAGEIVEVPASEVDYAHILPEALFDVNSSAVPFLSHNNGIRLMHAAKMGVQSRTLIRREVPKVQVAMATGGTIEESIGKSFSIRAPVSGVVKSITKDEIVIDDTRVSMPHYFPLNNDNHWHATVIVKVGDKVSKGDLLADTNHTKDGVLAQGTNLRVAYVPYKGLNFEDGVVISDGAAKKMTSEHVYQMPFPFDADVVFNSKRYQAYFPGKFTIVQMKHIGDDGVVKKGTVLKYGDPMVLALRPQRLGTETERLARVSRMLVKDFKDASLVWGKQMNGEVVDIARRQDEIIVHVRTEEPMRVGDKLVGRYGNKGVVVHVIPDNEMPRDAKGRVLDLLLNPNGVVGRMNLGQVLETTATKLIEKTGKPYIVRGFGEDSTAKITEELKKAGIKDHESIFDPVENVEIPGILVGEQYIYKLEHQVTKKISARGGGPDALAHGETYTSEMQPGSGAGVGGRAIGTMELYALLAHGANKNIHEMFTQKSDFDPDFWRAFEAGETLPPPKPTFSQKKFVSYLRGMGVDIREEKDRARMVPFLDKQVLAASGGEVRNAQLLRDSDSMEMAGGLFDPKATGGVRGGKMSHITLPSPIVNPLFAKAVGALLHKSEEDLLEMDGEAVKKELSSINLDKRIKEASDEIRGKKGTPLNKLHRELRYLKALKETKTRPEEYVISHVPVIPPIFRPVYVQPNGSMRVSDVNYHYQALMQLNELARKQAGKPEYADKQGEIRKKLYMGVAGIMGMEDGIVERKGQDIKGIADYLGGRGSPKGGYVHSTMLKRRQDVSATTVATVNPKLGLDELGLPEETAWKMFRPFVVRELRRIGHTPLSAREATEKRMPIAREALENVMRDRVVMMNRAPSLHKFSILAFKPRLAKGYAVEVNPFVFNGFNLDLDGDTLGLHTPISEEAVAEAKKMLPSNHLYKPGTGSLMPKLGQEYVLGLYRVSVPATPSTKVYKSIGEVLADLNAKRIAPDAAVSVAGIGSTTPGRVLINEAIPSQVRDYGLVWTAKATNAKLVEIDKKAGREAFSKSLSALSDIGRRYSYLMGSSFLLSDLQTMTGQRDAAYRMADKEADKIRRSTGTDEEKKKKIVDIYQKVTGQLMGQIDLKRNNANQPNNITQMLISGARGDIKQVRQLVSNVGVMLDHEARPMALPVRGTYTEGLDTAEYFQHMYGGRKGMIDKSQAVKDPGALTKQMVVSATGFRVAAMDCGTLEGIIEDVSGDAALDRYLAEDVAGVAKRNELITTTMLGAIRGKGVKQVRVRSVLTCRIPRGVCVRCYGLNEDGQPPWIGEAVGVKDSHAITEPSTQLAMKQFHLGGVAQGKATLTSGFQRAAQLFRMPEHIADSAVVSEVAGRVEKITVSPFGGWVVKVGIKDHKIPQAKGLKVKVGDLVQPGQALSDGQVKPQDVLRLQGLRPMQMSLRNDILSTFAAGDVNLKAKTVETAVKMLTDTVRVSDQGDHPHLIVGDYSAMSQVDDWNRKNPGSDKVKYVHDLPGSEFLPHRQDDWAQRMAHNRIRGVLEDAAPSAGSASFAGPSPFASLFFGKAPPTVSAKGA